jgi:hypothetical protein
MEPALSSSPLYLRASDAGSSARRAAVFVETERYRWRGEEPYSCTATTPDAGSAKVSAKNAPF